MYAQALKLRTVPLVIHDIRRGDRPGDSNMTRFSSVFHDDEFSTSKHVVASSGGAILQSLTSEPGADGRVRVESVGAARDRIESP